jgi:hypothetical protein
MKVYNIIPILLASAGFASAATFWGVTNNNSLVSFDSSNPGVFQSTASITGLVGVDGQTPDPLAFIVNLSFNPGTGQFTGIDTNSNIYRIGLSGSSTLLNSTFSPAGFDAGLAYDPVTDGFLYADDAAARFNITNAGIATLVGSAFYGEGDTNQLSTPSIFGVAIDSALGSTYFLDANLGILAQAIEPDALELFTVGSLGTAVTAYGGLAFDSAGNLFASLSSDSLNSGFYSINQSNGAATLIGSFGQGVGVSTITIPEPSAALLGAIGALVLLRRRRA